MPDSRCSPRRWRRRSSSERRAQPGFRRHTFRTTRTSCPFLLLIGLLIAGCGGSYSASPGQVVEGYEQALATGGYSAACHFLAPQTREQLAHDGGASNCAAAVARCLPNNALVPKKDQSQLLFATVVTSGHGSGTKVSISGNQVANAIRKVSLKPKPGGWILTSYGEGFTGCQPGHKKTPSQGRTPSHPRRH